MTETYLVPAANLPILTDRITKLNRRAARLGMEPVRYDIDPEERVVDVRVPDDKTIKVIHQSVMISGDPITESGWTFVATLHHEGEGRTLVAALPGETIPVAYRWANNVCDHCGAARRRNATFLIRHEADESHLYQVGRNCLADFLPRANRDPANLARWAEVWGAFWVELDGVEKLEWMGAGRPEWMEPLDSFLTVTSLLLRNVEWTSRGKARDQGGRATADFVMDYFYGAGRKVATWRKEIGEPTEADKERAEKVVAWAEESLLTDDESLSDYEHNLSVVVRLGLVRHRHIGLATSMINAWQRATGEKERTARASRPPSQHVGEDGARVRLHNVNVSFTKEMEDKGWGASLLIKMLHDGRNVLTWFASASAAWPEPGDVIDLKGTVKRHGDYKGEAETMLTRVTWIRSPGEDQDLQRQYRATVGKGKVAYDDRDA